MPKISPILIFTGQANQALKLYEEAFGAKVKVKMLYSDAASTGFKYKEDEKDFIYHSQIIIGNQIVMICDDSADVLENSTQGKFDRSFLIDLVVEFDSDNELKATYEKLSEGATITEALHSPHYCSLCAVLTDKFGGRWQLMSGYDG
ncbi:MAG: VOC family protein [Defluviitaleaceae bacterium]|nr:VOC family protein [Defluviitaleaceae bacterium]